MIRRGFGNLGVRIGASVLVLFTITAIFAPVLAPYSFHQMDLSGQLALPSPEHLLGQNQQGQDILTMLFFGARTSLLVAFFTVLISATLGLAIGLSAGYYAGKWDQTVARITDVFLAFPGLLLAILVSSILDPSILNVVVALCISGWVPFARIVRVRTLSLREADFIHAAKLMGAGSVRILGRHILPALWGLLLVQLVFSAAVAILAESGLSFLGLGVRGEIPSWGTLISDGTRYLFQAPHLSIFPGLAIVSLVLSLNLIGDGLRSEIEIG